MKEQKMRGEEALKLGKIPNHTQPPKKEEGRSPKKKRKEKKKNESSQSPRGCKPARLLIDTAPCTVVKERGLHGGSGCVHHGRS